MGRGDHPKTFLLKALCCQISPSWLKAGCGWVVALGIRVSGFELFCFKSIPRWRGDVIMIENDVEPKKGVTKGLKPPGQHLKTND